MQASADGGAGGEAKWLKEAEEDVRGEERQDGGDAEGRSEGHYTYIGPWNTVT